MSLQPENPTGQEKIMAEIQDVVDLEASDLGEMEAVEQISQPEVIKETASLPEKYRGKSVEDIVRMHQEAEKLVDRQAVEVGEVRKLADELLKSQLYKKPVEEQPVEVDFFENPQEAIRNAVNNNPKVLAAEQTALYQQRVLASQTIAQLHPDFQQVVADSEFKNWINSSKIRSQLYNNAENYDVEAANELLSTFKELKAVKQVQQTAKLSEVEIATRDKSLSAASVESGGTSESFKKVYRRADLIRLRLQNPAKYDSMQDDIDRAYQEGRVR